jgi:hypothetical protein
MLPDGKHFLIGMVGGTAQGTYLGTLDGSPPVRLTTDSGPATWLPTGWMVWVRFDSSQSPPTGPLLAQRLDLGSARLVGEPVSIAGDVGDFSATESGLLAYRTVRVTEQRQLSWVDRSGTELGTVGNADSTLNAPRVAPDGRRVAVSRLAHGNRDLWLLDGARASRMTFNEADDNYPVWSPDGLRITFSSNRSGVFNLYERLASGAGGEKSLKKDETADIPSGWSADDRYLLYFNCPIACGHIDVLPRSGDGKSFVFLNTSFNEIWGQFSPDGKWVAYQSNESGKYEIFVRPFHPPGSAGEADSNAAQWMVSTAGGIAPTWSADGKELYYLNPAGVMMAASIKVDRFAVVPGTPIKLFDAHIVGGGVDNGTGRQYDVARDGRFLINRVRNEEAIPAITLLQNWNPGAKKQ